MTLHDFTKNPENITAYKKWVNTDIGILVCSVLQETFCRPNVPSAKDLNPSTAEFCLGKQAGAWEMLDALRGLESLGQDVPDLPEPTYGANMEDSEKER